MKPGRARNIIAGFCEIADGLISVFTLGGYHATLTFRFVAWAEIRDLKRRRMKP